MIFEILIAFCLGALFVLLGVSLGAYAVFKTKRDPYEPFFGSQGKGDSFNIDDGLEMDEDVKSKPIPKATSKANNAFLDQFVKGVADKAGEK